MTWASNLAREVRLEFESAQRMGRAIFDRTEEDAKPLGPRPEPAVNRKRRIVERRVET